MTNEVIVRLDTDSKETIQIGKSSPVPPQSEEELRQVVLLDIATMCEALVVLIRAAAQMGVKSEGASMTDSIHYIEEAFTDTSLQVESRIEKLMK